MAEETDTNTLELATELTIAWLSNPNTRASADEVPAFLEKMHGAVAALSSSASDTAVQAPAEEGFTPAVSVRKSLASKEHLISLIDGKPYKTLKRHLTRHGLTPEQYRERYKLRSDYPMVAESYAEMRRGMAKKIGLGRKSAAASTPAPAIPAAEAAAKPARGRRKKNASEDASATPAKAA